MYPYTQEGLVTALRQYLSGQTTLLVLADWVDGYAWPFEEVSSPFADNLAIVELAIHELSDGTCSEVDVRDRLSSLLQDLEQPVTEASTTSFFVFPQPQTETGLACVATTPKMVRRLAEMEPQRSLQPLPTAV